MVEDVRAALRLLAQAMAIEREGRKFYLQAAQSARDEKGRETFTALAGDEEKHYELIKRQRDSLSRAGAWVTTPEVAPVHVDLSRPLFSGDKQGTAPMILPGSSEQDALLFGLDIESRSFELYRKGASETADLVAKQMFEFLAGQEQTHFDLLMMRYDVLFGPVAWRS
ncbi:MAG: ferritin family protein [Chloroflexi bacterium]|nr:ferritin family protein [Chloroflexota bacterium]